MSHRDLQVFSNLRSENSHWDLRLRVLPFEEVRRPRRSWDELVSVEQPDNLIVFSGNPVLSGWAVKRGIPMVNIGGHSGDFPVPLIGPTPFPLVKEAIDTLVAHGHAAICFPLLNLFSELSRTLQETVSKRFEHHGISFNPDWNMPTARFGTPDVLRNILNRVAAVSLPTAFIVPGWNEFLTIDSFLRQQRLRVPEDVSIILLKPGPGIEWVQPAITHFSYSVSRICRTVSHWVETDTREAKVVRLRANLVQGGSVGINSRSDPQ